MKQIIPFKKELLFKTKLSEITSISLEHTLTLKSDDMISGEFHISGDYKMTEGSIQREKFSFKLPFDIALDNDYDLDSIVIDIDNFYYEVINNESLQVNIDVYVEGTEKIKNVPVNEEVSADSEKPFIGTKEDVPDVRVEDFPKIEFPDISLQESDSLVKEERKDASEEVRDKVDINNFMPEIDFGKDPTLKEEELETMVSRDKGMSNSKMEEVNVIEDNSMNIEEGSKKQDFTIFGSLDNSETYVTYYVYIVKEVDTLDSIISKYGVSKEDISLYNDIENIKPGVKLIIPNTASHE